MSFDRQDAYWHEMVVDCRNLFLSLYYYGSKAPDKLYIFILNWINTIHFLLFKLGFRVFSLSIGSF